MKKILLPFICLFVILGSAYSQERYIDEVFDDYTVTPSNLYAENLTVIAANATPPQPYLPTGQFGIPALELDVYEPTGDTETERPLVIVLHTGTFAPIIYNGNPTGMRADYATTEMCISYAKRGYVVANVEYRLGWNPAAETQSERAASLMKAVYRAIQDTKAAVRYFRKDYTDNGNTFGIDPSKIILSGQGSGGWVALGYATVDKLAEIQLSKFLDLTDPANPVALIDTVMIGDWDGYGGQFNVENNVYYADGSPISNDIHMVCSMGGGIGDLSWLEAGDVPMCAVHCPTDPVAIYTTGDVAVAAAGVITTDISGSYDVMTKANSLGNNDVLAPANTWPDAYTLAAQAASANAQGMTDFGGTTVGAPVDNVFPYVTGNPFEASPWDLWDSTTTVNIALSLGLPAQAGIDAHVNNIAQNPDMGPVKANAYIDSTMGYFCRRIVRATNLDGANNVDELSTSNEVELYPNPAKDDLVIRSNGTITAIELFSATGELVKSTNNLTSNQVHLSHLNLKEGLYLCTVHIDGQTVTKRVVIQ
jgi:hypothetical protein